jgi:sugar lactone lactonase YvrE
MLTLDFTDQGQTGMSDQSGLVYRLGVDGKLDTLLSNGISPNGLVLSPDQKVHHPFPWYVRR